MSEGLSIQEHGLVLNRVDNQTLGLNCGGGRSLPVFQTATFSGKLRAWTCMLLLISKQS